MYRSFLKNAEGKIHVFSPWRLVDYWSWTKAPDLADFVVRSAWTVPIPQPGS